MEEPQHRTRIVAHRDSEMVYSKQRFLGMAFVWAEFPTVGSWQTCEVFLSLIPSLRRIALPVHSGRREERPLVRQSFLVSVVVA